MKSSIKRDGFDEAWQKALANAEKAPPLAVWDRIESAVSGAEAGKYKRRLIYFKWAAAASFLLTIGIAVYTWYILQSTQGDRGVAGILSSETAGEETISSAEKMDTQANFPPAIENIAGEQDNAFPETGDDNISTIVTEPSQTSSLHSDKVQSSGTLPFLRCRS